MLTQMTQRLLQNRTFEGAIQTILDDVIALLGAEYGNIQLPAGNELVIAAQRGLSAAFLRAFRRVKKEDGSACGRALRLGETVIIRDVDQDPDFAAFRVDAKSAGFRSVQSTPFFASDGNLMGLISTHFANVHEPSEIELQTLKTYGISAADHLQRLLGDAVLAARAEQMSQELYTRTLSLEGFRTRPGSQDSSASP